MESFDRENLIEVMDKNIKLRERDVTVAYEKSFNEAKKHFGEFNHSMEKALLRMEGVNPLNQFRKGYSITENKIREIVKSIDDIGVGEEINTILSDGKITSKILKISKKGV